jgi:hypothetical protein
MSESNMSSGVNDISIEELEQTLNALNTGVYPVDESSLDEVLRLMETVASTIRSTLADKHFGKEDFDALKPLWEQCWTVWGKVDEIAKDVKDLGLLKKVIYAVRAFLALGQIMEAIQEVRKK